MLSVTHGIGPPVVSRKADLHKYLTVIHNGYVSLQLWVCPKGSSMGEGVLCWGFVTCIVEVPGISSLSFKNIPMSDGDPCRRKKCVFLLVLNVASDLLGLDAFQLSEVLTQRSMILRGEEISSPLTVEQVSVLVFAPTSGTSAFPGPESSPCVTLSSPGPSVFSGILPLLVAQVPVLTLLFRLYRGVHLQMPVHSTSFKSPSLTRSWSHLCPAEGASDALW